MTIEQDYDQFVRLVSEMFDISLEKITTGNRDQDAVAGRRVVAACMRQRGYSYPAIGKAMACDHSTVIRLVECFPDKYPTDRRNDNLRGKIALAHKRADMVMRHATTQPPVERGGLGWRRWRTASVPVDPLDTDRVRYEAALDAYRQAPAGSRAATWQRLMQPLFPTTANTLPYEAGDAA